MRSLSVLEKREELEADAQKKAGSRSGTLPCKEDVNRLAWSETPGEIGEGPVPKGRTYGKKWEKRGEEGDHQSESGSREGGHGCLFRIQS